MSHPSLSERRIVLGVSGSIAAYKACELVRRLRDAGAEVRVVMTANALRFVGADTLRSLSGHRVSTAMFTSESEPIPEHLSLKQWADLIVIAPATANIIGKAAAGIADDLLSAAILSAFPRVLFAPAMNSAMYRNPVLQENVAKLRRLGCEFVGPEAGLLACGEEGPGRLADTDVILERIQAALTDAD